MSRIDCAPYEKLLSTVRLRPSTKGKRPSAVETGSDRGRVVFSSAFRRLQQKAQVFPLDSNAAVRTRLTHSLEVAHTGRYLAQEVLFRIREANSPSYHKTWLSSHEAVFTDIVEGACLIHDIGNPPFGHFGEAAIRDWFKEEGREILKLFAKKEGISASQRSKYLANEFADFLAFDGNPQGLRLVTKLLGDDGRSGLNLTCALLAAYLKYTVLPTMCQMVNAKARSKKAGYFCTETDEVRKIVTTLGMAKNKRHPLSYLMEAADDISYCMSDMEDGIEKGVITVGRVFDEVSKRWKEKTALVRGLTKGYADNLIEEATRQNVLDPFVAFKTSIINAAVEHAADAYVDGHSEILIGTHKGLIRGDVNIVQLLEVVREFVRATVFRSEEAENVELAGYSTICGLLKEFASLLSLPSEVFQNLISGAPIKQRDYEVRLVNRLSEKSKKAYSEGVGTSKRPLVEWHHRAHLIVDNVSGMTDHYAVRVHQLLTGIKIVA